MSTSELLVVAEMHAARLHEDIALATTRQEHIRVTARANEAAEIVNGLRALTPVKNISGMGFID